MIFISVTSQSNKEKQILSAGHLHRVTFQSYSQRQPEKRMPLAIALAAGKSSFSGTSSLGGQPGRRRSHGRPAASSERSVSWLCTALSWKPVSSWRMAPVRDLGFLPVRTGGCPAVALVLAKPLALGGAARPSLAQRQPARFGLKVLGVGQLLGPAQRRGLGVHDYQPGDKPYDHEQRQRDARPAVDLIKKTLHGADLSMSKCQRRAATRLSHGPKPLIEQP